MEKRTEEQFQKFQQRLQEELFTHSIIQHNPYCEWFAEADLTREDVRQFTIEFSVFSNQFLVAQLQKMINAVDLQEMRAAKEILANEIGCVFRRSTEESKESLKYREAHAEDDGDPRYVNIEGTVDGGVFRFRAAHFEWLLHFAEPLGLTFQDIGKRSHGSPSTLFYCDELIRIYGSDDYNIGAGASFAVENWAADGFWKQLVQGLKRFKGEHLPELPVSFFTWHDKVEDQHKEHTHDELRELYFGPYPFDEDKFIAAGIEMLDGVEVFWKGLNDERLARHGNHDMSFVSTPSPASENAPIH